jgi:hypothetical protein
MEDLIKTNKMKQEIKDLLKEMRRLVGQTHVEEFIKLNPEMFKEELIVGEWYKLFEDKRTTLVNFQGATGSNFGFNWAGDWTTSFGYIAFNAGRYIPATMEEVENALTNEAKKRGVWNVPIIDIHGNKQECQVSIIEYDGRFNILRSKYGNVFSGGKWTTPLKDDKKERLIELTTEFLKELNK